MKENKSKGLKEINNTSSKGLVKLKDTIDIENYDVLVQNIKENKTYKVSSSLFGTPSGGGAVLFPNGFEDVTESRNFQHSDVGKALRLAADDVFLTMPEGQFWTEEEKGQVIVVIADAVNVGFDKTFETPVLMQSIDGDNSMVGEYCLLVTGETDGQSDFGTISTAVIKDGDDWKTAIKALYDRSPFGAAASFGDVTGAERVGTSIGSVTTVELALLMAIFAPIFPAGIRVVTSSRDWEADDINALVVVDENCELTMPASSPFNDKEIVHIATQQYTNGATTGKFQLKNGGQFASNLYINDAIDSNRLEIVKMFWSAGEGRFYPLNTAYVSTGGELKSALKYNYDNAGFRGTATLVNGTVTVNNTNIKSGWKIYVSVNEPIGTQGFLSADTGDITNGVSFVINSTDSGDNSSINWWITP